MKHILEMKYPSSWWHDLWREGLATGNGYTGANLYGGAKREILQLNRHDFWCEGKDTQIPDVREAFGRLRRKMDEGRFKEASWELVNALVKEGYGSELEVQLPMADLIVEQTPIRGFCHFRRFLDMEKAVACQTWRDGSAVMKREVFVSREKDMAVYRLSAEKAEGAIEYKLSLAAHQNEGELETEAVKTIREHQKREAVCLGEREGCLFFNSRRSQNGALSQDFGAVANVRLSGGHLEVFGDSLKVFDAQEVLICVRLYLDRERDSAWQELERELTGEKRGYEELLAVSAELHGRLYHSAELSLGAKDWEKSNEELLMEAFSERQSKELIEKLWHYGRYLFLCGSAPEANPLPLYGLWSGTYRPLWCHNMANENLQMIYWHSLTGNLVEYQRAIFQYMNERIPAFRKNAERLFGIEGIYMTAGTTPGVASPTQVVPVIINWVGAAGWIAQHYYQYYLYTKDAEYARKEILPYMDGVAAFYEAFVEFTKGDDGRERIRFYPSVSPENTPQNFMPPEGVQMAHPMPTTVNATIDLSILKEFFNNLLAFQESCPAGEFTPQRIALWHRILDAIPEFAVNEKGAVKEWQEDIFEDRYDHRHLSHIYPVFPGFMLYPEKDAEKLEAYEKAVRLRKIDAQTGWSMAHMAAIYARFQRGEDAMECLDNMAKSCLLPNLFTLHNDWRGMNISLTMDPAPVQLDAVMGYVNALQETLLYASEGYLAFLPALEERLFAGEVKRFRYSDGLIHMKWDVEERRFFCELTPLRPHSVQVVLPEYAGSVRWTGGFEREPVCLRKNVWELSIGTQKVCVSTLD